MKLYRIFLLVFTIILLTSCSTSRNVRHRTSDYKKKTERTHRNSVTKTTNTVLKEAYKYLGTPYKFGGSTSSGMDCSGLVINAYDAAGIQMPRISREQANEGKEIRIREVQEGDLLFFNTSGKGISHVGIVEKIKNGEIFFIHSSTSKGVIISSMEESYWSKRFVKATRVL